MYPYSIKQKSKYNISSQETSGNSAKTSENNKQSDDSQSIKVLEMCMQYLADSAEFFKEFALLTNEIGTKELILKMYLNKCKAEKMLADIYFKISGSRLNTKAPNNAEISENLSENALSAMFSELENIDIFRALLFNLLNVGFRDMLYEIITDMQINAQFLNYLYYKYSYVPQS